MEDSLELADPPCLLDPELVRPLEQELADPPELPSLELGEDVLRSKYVPPPTS